MICLIGLTWEYNSLKILSRSDMCIIVPIVKPPSLGSVLFEDDRRRRRDSDDIPNTTLSELGEQSFAENPDESATTTIGYDEPTTTIRNEEDELSKAEFYSLELYPDPYCKMIEKMPKTCLEWSILELWGNEGAFDEASDLEIEMLTKEKILERINNVNRSGIFLSDKNFKDFLGGISYDEHGRITGARATQIQWFGRMNATEALLNPAPDRDEPIDRTTLDFEGDMLAVLLNSSWYPQGLRSYPNVQRSFGDISSSQISEDVVYAGASFMILTFYIVCTLGKFGWVEHRVNLTFAGLASVAFGIVVSYGLCSGVGLFFGPMHNALPFLLLGIGIDDMFVIVQSWDNLSRGETQGLTLAEKFGLTMSKSGVAITITSVTDVVAFAVGGSTVLPSLRSFCFFASVGIIAVFFFQVTFFVAIMAIDQRRVESNRNGFLPCFKHKKKTESVCKNQNFGGKIFDVYGKYLMTVPAKIMMTILTLALLGIAIWGNILLEQKFVPAWFLPQESYLAKWFGVNEKYFPFGGERITVWLHDVDYTTEMENVWKLSNMLKNQTDIIDNVDSWVEKFVDYSKLSSPVLPSFSGDFDQFHDSLYFSHKMTQFLFSPSGAKYRSQFVFDQGLLCGYSAPRMVLTDLTFTHKVFSGPSQHIPAMNRVKNLIQDANLTGKVFPLSIGYATWETDEVIASELYRNLGLAVLCIFVVTLVLFGTIWYSTLVLAMVIISVVEVAGFMHFWGLTIDTVSCVNLIIGFGLCVDYSVHVTHWYIEERGVTRSERVRSTLRSIGPAVFHGGVSTFLAFVLLAGSKSHVFTTFFKIFTLVVVFGLFQGLGILPVILSFIGTNSQGEDLEANMNDNEEGN